MLRNTSGRLPAKRRAIDPPIEFPTTCAGAMPSFSMSAPRSSSCLEDVPIALAVTAAIVGHDLVRAGELVDHGLPAVVIAPASVNEHERIAFANHLVIQLHAVRA